MRTFRAWINEQGSNEDRNHSWTLEGNFCKHARLVDLETNDYRILLRFVRGRRPLHFSIVAFFRPHRGTTLLRIGRRLW